MHEVSEVTTSLRNQKGELSGKGTTSYVVCAGKAATSYWAALGRGNAKETGNCNATAISGKIRRFQAGNWLPD
jgi:hypothetical protein